MSFEIAKRKDRVRSKVYLAFVAEHRCCKCDVYGVQCHHSTSRKWASGSDLLCVPLCARCHNLVRATDKMELVVASLQQEFSSRYGYTWTDERAFEEWMLKMKLAKRGGDSRRRNR